MFTPEKLQSALVIFQSLYPDYADSFKTDDNAITLIVDDFREICFDFDKFYNRKCFTMTASTFFSEGMKYVITDCDLTLLQELQKNWKDKWNWLDEKGYKDQKPKKGLGYDYVYVGDQVVSMAEFNKSQFAKGGGWGLFTSSGSEASEIKEEDTAGLKVKNI